MAQAGRDPGVTVAEVNLKLIWDVINALKVGKGGYAYVVDGQGRLIAHPDISLVLRDTDLSQFPQVAAALAAGSAVAPSATSGGGSAQLPPPPAGPGHPILPRQRGRVGVGASRAGGHDRQKHRRQIGAERARGYPRPRLDRLCRSADERGPGAALRLGDAHGRAAAPRPRARGIGGVVSRPPA